MFTFEEPFQEIVNDTENFSYRKFKNKNDTWHKLPVYKKVCLRNNNPITRILSKTHSRVYVSSKVGVFFRCKKKKKTYI